MGEWKKTGCVLCAQNCGLEVLVENNKIVKVKPDKDNPRSKGYVCRKGINVANHQHHDDRLTHPLKKTEDGFAKISWDQAISEISEKLKSIVGTHGPKSYAYMGGGGQGCHFEAAFGNILMKGLGSKYVYNALAQELTGYFWVCGRATGRQNRFLIPDEHGAEMILAVGWNGMVSHQMPQAPKVLKKFSKDPDKILAVIDPRLSETAREANIHIPVKPGTDALLFRAMIAIILNEGWEDRGYIEKYTTGFENVEALFNGFDIDGALKVCELEYDQVYDLCRELGRRKWCMHCDLGIWMNRHSTATAYLSTLLSVICGRACVPGGNIIPGSVVPLGSHTDEREGKNWRTVETDMPALSGAFPPNVMPEEILSEHPERLRAVITCSSNPLRSYADTTLYEKAFKKLDLLVTIELAMTETAELADYVLPARSGYESWDSTFFAWTYPEVYFQMRRPVVEPVGEPLECGEIFTRIADGAGLIPHIPESLYVAAKSDRLTYAMALFSYVKRTPKAIKVLPMVIAKTLGKEMGSVHLSALWGLLLASPPLFKANASRAGFKKISVIQSVLSVKKLAKVIKAIFTNKSIVPIAGLSPDIELGENIFQAVIDHQEGFWIGKADSNNMSMIKHDDKKIHMHIPELDEWVKSINPLNENKELQMTEEYPLVLMAGRHISTNANTLMRNPEWNRDKRACTLAMNTADAEKLEVDDYEQVRIVTEAGSEIAEVEISEDIRKGQVVIPHGFGMKYKGKTYGVNVNRLTKNTHRDRFAGTPIHRYVPCRIEKLLNN